MGHATPTAERAYEHVKDLILDGTYGSGELLTEGQVATWACPALRSARRS
ncbi:hypothetical protein ACIPPN_03740 [Streptomyces diastaticus]